MAASWLSAQFYMYTGEGFSRKAVQTLRNLSSVLGQWPSKGRLHSITHSLKTSLLLWGTLSGCNPSLPATLYPWRWHPLPFHTSLIWEISDTLCLLSSHSLCSWRTPSLPLILRLKYICTELRWTKATPDSVLLFFLLYVLRYST